MSRSTLTVGLITDVFYDDPSGERLRARLEEARGLGAELAVLPELPLNSWCPASRTASDADAEPPGGGRQQTLARAAQAAGVAVLGGAIVREPTSGRRHNTALLIDERGEVVARYAKLHVPWEEGYWEADHYEAGAEPPVPFELRGFALGIQICSDVNRPEPSHVLSALGALAVLAPRATPPQTYERWRLVLRALAVTSCLYVISVNRPGPEPGTSIGGPSLAIAPDGSVLLEIEDPLAVVTLERAVVEAARQVYPGYLATRGDVYAKGWQKVMEKQGLTRHRPSEAK